MGTKILHPDEPIIIGFHGLAGSGKTSVGDSFVPGGVVNFINEQIDGKSIPKYIIDHYWFAMPLYELVAIKRTIEGESRRDRQLYEIHKVLVDIFNNSPLYGAPPYDELTAVVNKIQEMYLPEGKPRTFMQEAGDICRFYDHDCFTKWMLRHIRNQASQHMRSTDDWDAPQFIAIVSDIRYNNEAEMVAKSPNGLVIEFTADQEVLDKRIEKRDGFVMTEDQKNHRSEAAEIDKELIDITIDTTEMSLEEQFNITKNFIRESFELSQL